MTLVGEICWEVGFLEPASSGCTVSLEKDAGEWFYGVAVVFNKDGDVDSKEFEAVQGQAAS